MTDLSEARARAVEARDEARNHVENFPSSEGDAVRVARLADVIDALLAASTPVGGDEREALTRSDDDIMITIRHEGGNTLRGTVQQVCGTHLAKGWSLEAGPERRTPLRRPSTPLPKAFTEEDVERAAEALSIAAEGKPLCDLRMSDHDEFMREARAVVAALSAVHPEVTQ